MAGQLTIDTLKAGSGVLATQNGMTGIAKAWVNFQGGSGNTAGVITGSFNVSSVTVGGTGYFVVNFTTAMPNANYATAGAASADTATYPCIMLTNSTSGASFSAQTTTTCPIAVARTQTNVVSATIVVNFVAYSS